MALYKMLLAYDGTEYQGWQTQKHGDTVQARLIHALSKMAKTPVQVTAAGRTDAGVHALGQCVHFALEHEIPAKGILMGANSILPDDIRVLSVHPAPKGFHARYSACSKTYHFRIDRSLVPLPHQCRFSVHYPHNLSIKLLQEAAILINGEHDFVAFRASSCSAKTTLRRIYVSQWIETGSELVYEVKGSGFLHHMIRNIVGTLLEIGREKRPISSICNLLKEGKRSQAGPTAAAKGLHLVKVDYP